MTVLIMRKKINKDKSWQVAFTDLNNKVLLVCGINNEGYFYSVANNKKYKAFYTDYSNIKMKKNEEDNCLYIVEKEDDNK